MIYGYFFRWAWSLLEEPAGVKEGAGQLVPVGGSGRNNVINTESIVQLSQDSKLQILLFVCLLVHICQQA